MWWRIVAVLLLYVAVAAAGSTRPLRAPSATSLGTPSPRHPRLPGNWTWAQYHSHEEVVAFLFWIQATFPDVATVRSIGRR